MNYLVVGINHHSAPLELREKLSVGKSLLEGALTNLSRLNPDDEVVLLSTCNRVEIYAGCNNPELTAENINSFLATFNGVAGEALKPHLYFKHGREALAHLFRVTSSLDSMVVGEAQIVGQVKEAYAKAKENNCVGSFLGRAFERALYVSKRVRSETTLSARSVSVGSVAVDLARKIFEDLASKQVVLIGAGEMAELIVTYLADLGVHHFKIINRNQERASELLSDGIGEVYPFQALEELVKEADLVISSVALSAPLIQANQVAGYMETRQDRPLFFIDLGVPRNIDPAIGELNNVYLYNIDDLSTVADGHKEERVSEAVKATALIEKEAVQFCKAMVEESPTIALMGKKFDSLRRDELQKTFARLPDLSSAQKRAFEKCTESIVNKILFDPMMTLKREEKTHHQTIHDLLRMIFRLND